MYNTYVTKQLFFAEGLVMNNERMPINMYKLDAGYNDKGMNSNELIKDYKRNIHKWYFIAADYLYCSIGTAYSKYCQDSWISFTV